jgi:hypothetical protein
MEELQRKSYTDFTLRIPESEICVRIIARGQIYSEMGEASSKHGGYEKLHTKFWPENLKNETI